MIENRVQKIIDLVSSEYDIDVIIKFNKIEKVESSLEFRWKIYYDYMVINPIFKSNSIICTNEQIHNLNYLYKTFSDILDSEILSQYRA